MFNLAFVKKRIPQSFMALTAIATLVGSVTPAQAYNMFFGEDLGLGENTRLSSHPNADNARTQFLSNLVGVGTENFESFTPGTGAPLNLSFSGAGTATLEGDGTIKSVPTGTDGVGRYPISGNQYWENSDVFSINFSQPVAAFGFNGVDIGDFGGQVTLTLQSGITQTLTIPNTTNGQGGSVLYYGITTTDPNEVFTKVTFGDTQAGTDFFAFDDMTIGSIQQVRPPLPIPEPATILGVLLVGALLCSNAPQKKKVNDTDILHPHSMLPRG